MTVQMFSGYSSPRQSFKYIMYKWVTIATVIFYETLLFFKSVLELQLVWPSESPSLTSQLVCEISFHIIQANVASQIKFQ